MAQLKPLPKAILVAVVLGAIGYGVYASGILNKLGKKAEKDTWITAPSESTPATPAKSETASTPPSAPLKTSGIGSAGNPLKISFLSFHGYAPGLIANGGKFETQPGSINAKNGLNVQFNMQDDFPDLTTIWESGSGHCVVRTSDFWAQIQPNLRNSGHDGKVVMLIANTKGGDAIIARDPNIKSIEDLAGKSVALLQFTPSHGLLIDAIENSSLSARKKQSIKPVFINADEGTAGVRAAYESGKVDAAVLWDPDLSLASRKSGSHVVYSTKTATNLIFDVMICDTRVIKSPAGHEAIQKLVQGWMEGATVAKNDIDQAAKVIVDNEQMFQLLDKQEGRNFVKGLFGNVDMTDLSDNARILGLAGGTNHYERVYSQFDQVYRGAGALANPKSPVIPAQDSIDYSFIKTLLSKNTQATQAAQAPTETFTEQKAAAIKTPAQVTKPVQIRFESGSAELNQRAKKTIDDQMVPFIENNGSAYIEISGNTDSTGSDSVNRPLSQRRAAVVVDYLVKQWDMPAARFRVAGNGSSKPICNEQNPSADGLDLEGCRAENRTTRVGIIAR